VLFNVKRQQATQEGEKKDPGCLHRPLTRDLHTGSLDIVLLSTVEIVIIFISAP
jgi:hypothetical protein